MNFVLRESRYVHRTSHFNGFSKRHFNRLLPEHWLRNAMFVQMYSALLLRFSVQHIYDNGKRKVIDDAEQIPTQIYFFLSQLLFANEPCFRLKVKLWSEITTPLEGKRLDASIWRTLLISCKHIVFYHLNVVCFLFSHLKCIFWSFGDCETWDATMKLDKLFWIQRLKTNRE